MSEADLEGFYRRYVAAANARRFDAIRDMIQDDVTINGVARKGVDVVASLREFATTVPDFVWTIQDLLVAGDRIAARLQDTGTPAAAFLGHKATGASISIMEFASYRVHDGRFAEMWFLMDTEMAAAQLRRDE